MLDMETTIKHAVDLEGLTVVNSRSEKVGGGDIVLSMFALSDGSRLVVCETRNGRTAFWSAGVK